MVHIRSPHLSCRPLNCNQLPLLSYSSKVISPRTESLSVRRCVDSQRATELEFAVSVEVIELRAERGKRGKGEAISRLSCGDEDDALSSSLEGRLLLLELRGTTAIPFTTRDTPRANARVKRRNAPTIGRVEG